MCIHTHLYTNTHSCIHRRKKITFFLFLETAFTYDGGITVRGSRSLTLLLKLAQNSEEHRVAPMGLITEPRRLLYLIAAVSHTSLLSRPATLPRSWVHDFSFLGIAIGALLFKFQTASVETLVSWLIGRRRHLWATYPRCPGWPPLIQHGKCSEL